MMRLLLGITGVLAICTPALAAGWGSVEGQFVLEGDVPNIPPLVTKGDSTAKDSQVCAAQDVPNDAMSFDKEAGGIANVFVYLKRAPEIHPDLKESKVKEVEFDQKGCRFLPHAMVVRTDQVVVCKSSDPVAHNLHTNPFANTAQNFTVAANDQSGQKVNMPVPEGLPVKVVCDIHNWMSAWWVVVNHPYAAVTDAQGRFKIENLPAGEHEFTVWHENAGYIDRKFKVKIEDGKTTALEPVAVPLSKFQK